MPHTSLAERFAFGTTVDDGVAEPHISVVPRSGTTLIARVLIAAIFLVSGFAKLSDPAGAIGHMQSVGIPAPHVLVYIAAYAEIFGAVALLFGFLARIGAFGLTVFMVITTVLFHAFWNYQGQEQIQQSVQFMKNLAIIGGLVLLFAVGPGRYSIDAKLRNPQQP
ncbi:MAG: DoxX family protein [Deltaproteobacteria bacterium]|nr:DoxX family protein [Deltaproteobacteria bacterium]